MGHRPSRAALPSPLAHPRRLLWCLMVSCQPWAAPLRHMCPDTQIAAPFEVPGPACNAALESSTHLKPIAVRLCLFFCWCS